jgi:SpoVK/Ycf46/Vps4 family AAA+-type ATPase
VTKNNDLYKTSVIDTLVEQVSGQAGEDRAIILLGYNEEMTRFFKNVNPGLSRRFQMENAFYFPDYDDLALVRILISKARSSGLNLDVPVAKRAIASLAKSRSKSHFGNAGALDNLLSAAKLKMQQRSCPDDTLTPADFNVELEGLDNNVLDPLFDDMIGCKDIKDKLKTLQDTVLFAQERGDDPKDFVSFNYLFVGNPGTGKTTVARKMGKMFKALGILPDDTVYEIAASDLSTGYSGQAGQKTRAELQKSRGGVLFIDEAYQLNPSRGGQYMTEAVDELVKCLTSPEFQGKLLVILAGYEKDMNEMLVTNAGLKSRFPEQMKFEDMDSNSAAILYAERMHKYNITISDCDMAELHKLTNRLVEIKEFGNGRDVETWAKLTYQYISVASRKQLNVGGRNRLSRGETNVKLPEMEAALEKLIANRVLVTDCKAIVHETTDSLVMRKESTKDPIHAQLQSIQQVGSQYATKAKVDKVVIEETQKSNPQPQAGSERNLFQVINPDALVLIQDFLVERGMNSEHGAKEFANLDPSNPLFQELVEKAIRALGWSHSFAKDQLVMWQNAQKKLWEEIEKEKELEKSAGRTMQAIWRCAVCGRADKPWIACFVAPYIVRYEPVGSD